MSPTRPAGPRARMGEKESTRPDTSRASTSPGTTILFALAVVCAFVAGLTLVDGSLDRGQGVPPVNASVDAPGVGYTGVVGAQAAEVRQEYEARSFDARLDAATANDSRAATVAAETDRIETRIADMERQRDALDEDGATRARVTGFVAETLVLADRLDRVETAAGTLSPSLRERHGLTDAAFAALRERTAALVTPDMVETARSVAGDDVGDDLDDSDDRDDDTGDRDDDGDDRDDQDDRDDDTDDSDERNDSDDQDDRDDDDRGDDDDDSAGDRDGAEAEDDGQERDRDDGDDEDDRETGDDDAEDGAGDD